MFGPFSSEMAPAIIEGRRLEEEEQINSESDLRDIVVKCKDSLGHFGATFGEEREREKYVVSVLHYICAFPLSHSSNTYFAELN